MVSLQAQRRQYLNALRTRLSWTLAVCAYITFAAVSTSAQLAANQTNGFGNNSLVTFTYLQNFDCVDQPTLDLDFNGVLAQSDPNDVRSGDIGNRTFRRHRLHFWPEGILQGLQGFFLQINVAEIIFHKTD